jgi:hypothetical protein
VRRHAAEGSGGFGEITAKPKAPKGETKGAFVAEGTPSGAGLAKTFQNAGDAKNGTAGL